jgi:hypothetical protein
MDISRKANREDHERTLQYQTRHEALLEEELTEDKLMKLRAFISHLDQTPLGAEELQRRIKTFGECKQIEGETLAEFYGRLRHWLDRDLPRTKSPLHPPRQNDD